MIQTYVKKPVKIKAVQWDGDNLYEVMSFMGTVKPIRSNIEGDKFEDYKIIVRANGLKINTLEGTMIADIGDYIIRGIKGEFYPCKPDIFKDSYSEVVQ